MKIGKYCQRQRCRHVELEQFWQAFASRGFVSDSWAFLFLISREDRTSQRRSECTRWHALIRIQTSKASIKPKKHHWLHTYVFTNRLYKAQVAWNIKNLFAVGHPWSGRHSAIAMYEIADTHRTVYAISPAICCASPISIFFIPHHCVTYYVALSDYIYR